MSDRPTPRTDSSIEKLRDGNGGIIWRIHPQVCRQLERELAEAREENLEQARLLGMSAEREADLRGELEREKRRAEKNGVLAHDLGIQLTFAREQRDHYLGECNRLHEDLQAERKSSFREERDRLAQVIKTPNANCPSVGATETDHE